MSLALDRQGKLVVKRNKYGVAPRGDRTVDGIVFASKREAMRYRELLLMQRCGDIRDLELQPRFILQEPFTKNGVRYASIRYIADFRYRCGEKLVIEDVKGKRTTVYCLKRKLFEARYPKFTISEV